MIDEDREPTLHRLRSLAVLEPDPARSERVRARCRAALARRPLEGAGATAPRRLTAQVLESGLTYGLSVGYLFALIDDLLRLYLRR